MNNLLKSIKLTALAAVLVGFASCQKDVDVLGISENLANQTLLGYYSYAVLDTVAMKTSTQEFYLTRDSSGIQNGYYRENVSGDGPSLDEKTPITWTSEMAPDQLSMLLAVKLEGGKARSLKWADGVIYEDDNLFAKNVAGLSDIDVQAKVYSQLENAVFEVADTVFHTHTVKVPYLAWNSNGIAYVAPEDTASWKQTKIDELEQQHDTIVWFMKNKTAAGYVGTYAHYVDTVIGGKDTTLLIDLVVVGGELNGKYAILYLKSKKEKEDVQKNDRPATILYSNMTFDRKEDKNTASYIWRKSEYSEEHYTKPGNAKDVGSDTLYTFTASSWMVPSFVNQAKFDVLLFGNSDSTLTKIDAGVETVIKEEKLNDVYMTLNLAGYGEKMAIDSTWYIEVQQGGLKYRLKQ